MDWFFDAYDAEAVRALRHDFRDYLGRHAEPDADLDGAEVAFSELITNAARHAPGPAWVHVDWSASQPIVEVHDLGPGFDLEAARRADSNAAGGRGLLLASHLTEELRVAAKRAGGSKVTAVLAVTRPPANVFEPHRARPASLPTPEEAQPDGTFPRDSFLRALVVEMARAVELEQGPAAAEALVAQVGADVGARAEEEYRRAREIMGRLAPEEIAEACVHLKRGLGGDFYVIEVTPERIVLGNRRCPFGDGAVTRAPGLCRMTSSVLGGIAARNADGASVVLEERIALGDPECRVVVWLREPGASAAG
jgi:anti-sigma regulatory factor (Ser/Thr protein kinase)